MNKQKRPGLFLQIAGVLLCLCLISTHFTTGLYAKYTNRAQGSDAARAAKFEVSISDVKGPEAFGEDLSGEYTFTVHNQSEVAVRFKAELTINPDEIKILAPGVEDGKATLVKEGAEEQNLVLTNVNSNCLTADYQKATMLAAGESVKLTVKLQFDADSVIAALAELGALDDKSGTFKNDDMSSLTGSLPFDVKVTFIQID